MAFVSNIEFFSLQLSGVIRAWPIVWWIGASEMIFRWLAGKKRFHFCEDCHNCVNVCRQKTILTHFRTSGLTRKTICRLGSTSCQTDWSAFRFCRKTGSARRQFQPWRWKTCWVFPTKLYEGKIIRSPSSGWPSQTPIWQRWKTRVVSRRNSTGAKFMIFLLFLANQGFFVEWFLGEKQDI